MSGFFINGLERIHDARLCPNTLGVGFPHKFEVSESRLRLFEVVVVELTQLFGVANDFIRVQ